MLVQPPLNIREFLASVAQAKVKSADIKSVAEKVALDCKQNMMQAILRLVPNAFYEYASAKKGKEKLPVFNLIQNFNFMINHVRAEILSAKSLSSLTQIATFYAYVLEASLQHHNYDMAYAILTAFQSQEIFRLRKLFATKEINSILSKADQVLDSGNAFRNYEVTLNQLPADEVIIPYLGNQLSVLTYSIAGFEPKVDPNTQQKIVNPRLQEQINGSVKNVERMKELYAKQKDQDLKSDINDEILKAHYDDILGDLRSNQIFFRLDFDEEENSLADFLLKCEKIRPPLLHLEIKLNDGAVLMQKDAYDYLLNQISYLTHMKKISLPDQVRILNLIHTLQGPDKRLKSSTEFTQIAQRFDRINEKNQGILNTLMDNILHYKELITHFPKVKEPHLREKMQEEMQAIERELALFTTSAVIESDPAIKEMTTYAQQEIEKLKADSQFVEIKSQMKSFSEDDRDKLLAEIASCEDPNRLTLLVALAVSSEEERAKKQQALDAYQQQATADSNLQDALPDAKAAQVAETTTDSRKAAIVFNPANNPKTLPPFIEPKPQIEPALTHTNTKITPTGSGDKSSN